MTSLEVRADLERRRSRRPVEESVTNGESLQQLLQADLEFLDAVRGAEGEWRKRLAEGKAPHDPELARMFTGYLREWETVAGQRLRQIAGLESSGCRVPRAEEFRKAVEEVRDELEERGWEELGRRARARMVEEE